MTPGRNTGGEDPTRRVTVVRDGEEYELTATHIDATRDGTVSIGYTDVDDVPYWMSLFSYGNKAIVYNDQYDAITFSSFDVLEDDPQVQHSEHDATLPSRRELTEQSD